MEPKYVVCWKSLLTGNTGRLRKEFVKSEADAIATGQNIQDAGDATYWIEPVPATDPAPDIHTNFDWE